MIMRQRFFDPAAMLQVVQDEKATDTHVVPTQLVSLLTLPDIEKYDLRCLKWIW
jgi:acyl-coenzyme A synthetase/AMP-(fatty) acid ligase